MQERKEKMTLKIRELEGPYIPETIEQNLQSQTEGILKKLKCI